MRHFVLVGLVIATSSAAVAYVCSHSNRSKCGTCILSPVEDSTPAPSDEPACAKCKSNVVDVVDLNTAYPVTTQTPGSTVSFEEPPFAKPRQPELLPTQFEVPAELAPAPREATELAPAPRLVK